MKKCRFCGYENPDGRHFCLYCHKTLDTFTSDFTSPEENITPAPNPGLGELSCPHCGKRNPADKMFCQNCRKSLKRISPVVEAEINCPHCNAKNPSSKAFCLHCGKSLHPIVEEPKRYCIQCGKPVIAENTVCDSCREKKRKQASLWIRAVAAVLVLALLFGIVIHFARNRAIKEDDKPMIIQSDFETIKPPLKQLSQVNVYLEGQMWQQHVFHYDASGKMVSTDIRFFGMPPNEQITCRYTYDAEGRLIKADRDDWWLDFSNEEYEYDNNGRLVCYKKYWGSSEPTTVVTYSYDLMGRLMQAMESDQDGIVFTSTFEHNSKGQVVEENKLYKPDNRSWTYTYTYDDQGRVTSDDVFSSYSYDSYPGFVISRWSDGSQKLRIMDVAGHDIWSISLGHSILATDDDGYLSHTTPTEEGIYEYAFFYDS